jgi:hypothetical protein
MKTKNNLYVALLALFISLNAYNAAPNNVAKISNDSMQISPSTDSLSRLHLDSPVTFFKDAVADWVPIPSMIYSPDELKDFLSTTTATNIRYELGTFRDEMIAKFWEENSKAEPDYITLSQEITKKYVEWIRRYLKNTMPMGISENDFAIVAFGSMARDEVAGPYTDLEAAVLIKNQDPVSLATARSLAQNISFWFNQVGEHPKLPMQKKGFRPDEAANFPFNLALHARGLTDASAYCLAFKSLPPPKPASGLVKMTSEEYSAWLETSDAKKWISQKEYLETAYPFEGTWAFINTPQNMANYFKTANYEFPWPVVLNENSKDEDWYVFGQKSMKNPMLDLDYIYRELSNSQCARDIGDAKAIASAAGKIRDKMIKSELNVIAGFDSIGRNTLHLFGNATLFDDYQQEVSRVLDGPDNLREKAFVRILHGLLLKFRKDNNGGQMFLNGQLGDVTDVKRILYRFEEQVWTTIGRLAQLPVQNVREILIQLADGGFISQEFAGQRIELLNNALGLRWKETILAGEQTSSSQDFISKAAYDKEVQKKEQSISALKTEISTILDSSAYRNAKNSLAQLKLILKNEADATKKAAIRADLNLKKGEFEALEAEHIKLNNKLISTTNKLKVLKALDPEAADPYFTKEDVAKWRDIYSKMSQDLYKRLLSFVGGIEALENKEYSMKNPDAFKDSFVAPEVDVPRLMKVP